MLKICNTCGLKKPITEFGGHNTTADGHNPKCKSCVSEYNKTYRTRNKVKIQENNKKYAIEHSTEAKERTRKWIKDNLERKRLHDKEYYQKNKERELAKSKERYNRNKKNIREQSKLWKKNNSARVNATLAKRRADKKQATPKWANLKNIRLIYKEAYNMTKRSGVEYQVDHIIPLNSKVVCGLHCEANLRIITATENNSKNNKLIKELL